MGSKKLQEQFLSANLLSCPQGDGAGCGVNILTSTIRRTSISPLFSLNERLQTLVYAGLELYGLMDMLMFGFVCILNMTKMIKRTYPYEERLQFIERDIFHNFLQKRRFWEEYVPMTTCYWLAFFSFLNI